MRAPNTTYTNQIPTFQIQKTYIPKPTNAPNVTTTKHNSTKYYLHQPNSLILNTEHQNPNIHKCPKYQQQQQYHNCPYYHRQLQQKSKILPTRSKILPPNTTITAPKYYHHIPINSHIPNDNHRPSTKQITNRKYQPNTKYQIPAEYLYPKYQPRTKHHIPNKYQTPKTD